MIEQMGVKQLRNVQEGSDYIAQFDLRVSVSSSFADLSSRLRQILMYNSNPEVVKQQEKEKEEKKLEKERNIVALYSPKRMNPLIQKKAEMLKTMDECTDSKSIIQVFRLTC
jgi:hypothetical protein